jgi:acyl-CoA reductase-like NAD-dependent aldehyde dehydrogenase
MIELIAAALPPGLVNIVSGDNDIGAALSRHEEIAKVVFTGFNRDGQEGHVERGAYLEAAHLGVGMATIRVSSCRTWT